MTTDCWHSSSVKDSYDEKTVSTVLCVFTGLCDYDRSHEACFLAWLLDRPDQQNQYQEHPSAIVVSITVVDSVRDLGVQYNTIFVYYELTVCSSTRET